jgi:hypothetical protein
MSVRFVSAWRIRLIRWRTTELGPFSGREDRRAVGRSIATLRRPSHQPLVNRAPEAAHFGPGSTPRPGNFRATAIRDFMHSYAYNRPVLAHVATGWRSRTDRLFRARRWRSRVTPVTGARRRTQPRPPAATSCAQSGPLRLSWPRPSHHARVATQPTHVQPTSVHAEDGRLGVSHRRYAPLLAKFVLFTEEPKFFCLVTVCTHGPLDSAPFGGEPRSRSRNSAQFFAASPQNRSRCTLREWTVQTSPYVVR